MEKKVFVLFCFSWLCLLCPILAAERTDTLRLAAHRGGITQGAFDEYDPASIDSAISKGYWMLEIDVRMTKDCQVIAMHDDNFLRIYGVNKLAKDLTLEEVKQLQALRGGYAPLTFEEVCRKCAGKTNIMLDIKEDKSSISEAFLTSIRNTLEAYGLQSTVYILQKEYKPFFKFGKYAVRMPDIYTVIGNASQKEELAEHYFLFEAGCRMTADAVRLCQKYGIEVCPSINFGHYRYEDYRGAVQRDIEYLKRCDVRFFQIDSDFDKYFDL